MERMNCLMELRPSNEVAYLLYLRLRQRATHSRRHLGDIAHCLEGIARRLNRRAKNVGLDRLWQLERRYQADAAKFGSSVLRCG